VGGQMHSGALSLASNEKLINDGVQRDQVFQEYRETERRIKEALIDRDCGYKLAEADLFPVAEGAVKHNAAEPYDVEQYETQPLQDIIQMYKPIEKEYARNTERESQQHLITRFIESQFDLKDQIRQKMEDKYKGKFQVANAPMMKCLVKPLGVYLKNNPGNLVDLDERAFDPITPYAQVKERLTKMKKAIKANTFQRTWATGQRFYQKSRSPIWRIPDMANN
jgi:hypothetical protein